MAWKCGAMRKIERRMDDLNLWGREEVKGSEAVELFLRDHIEKKTERLWSAVANAEMK
jgi:hypothetical protein